jgi:conjugal transfer pilus assembly protein TrbC
MLLFLFSTALAWENASWLNEVEKRLDEDAVAWLRKEINPTGEPPPSLPLQRDCKNCFRGKEIEEPKLLVFISFSVPENIWLSLAQEMKDYQALFVLRGLPDNSFKSFAQKMAHLKEQGMEASLQIHPQLFKDYDIKSVPSFVFVASDTIHKVSGAVSLDYALDLKGKTRKKK